MLSWSEINPFAEKKSPERPAPEKKESTEETAELNADGTPKVKSKPGEGDDQLAHFESFWQPNKDKDGKEILESNDDSTPYLPNIDQKKFGEIVGKMDFSKSFKPEHLAAIEKGGAEATQALVEMMNSVGRQSFAAAFTASQRATEAGFGNARNRFKSGLPEHVRDLMSDNGLNEALSITKNPVFEPMVKSVKAQYLKKFPKATPAEVNAGVKQYFDYLQKELSGGSKTAEETLDNKQKLRTGAGDANFLEWADQDLLRVVAPDNETQT